MLHNVLRLIVVRFQGIRQPNITDKAKCLLDICKEQITVFRGAALFTNAEAEYPNVISFIHKN